MKELNKNTAMYDEDLDILIFKFLISIKRLQISIFINPD